MVVASKETIPDGIPKSGRVWKVKQTSRASALLRTGLLQNQIKTLEEKQIIRTKKATILQLEREMKEESKKKREIQKEKRLENNKRRMANEYKNTSYQALNPEKIKTMSKKQLRMVRKTSMNKNGQVELVNPWESSTGNKRKK